MTHSLTLGSLLLTDGLPDDEHDFVFNVLADGMGFGVASSVQEIVTSLLADGDLVRTRRYGNREVTFAVEITGPSLAALAQGEAALRRELGRPNLLTWQAPDIFAAPTVFEVVDSEMSQSFNDLDELGRRRTYTVKLTCGPGARSAEMVTVAALEVGSTTVTVDTCDSAAGWTGTRNGAPSPGDGPTTLWESGAVSIMELSNTVGFPPETWTLTRTGAVDFTSTRYLEVEITTLSAKAGAPLSVSAHLNGSSTALPITQTRLLADGSKYFRVTFDTGGVAASSLTFKHTSASGYGHAWQGLQVRNVARTSVPPNITARQQTRIIEPGGTERTPASIHVEASSGATGLVQAVVHTCPEDGSGYSPPLRRWRISGQTPIADNGDLFSGSLENITGTGATFDIPTSALPEGGYILAANVRRSSEGAVGIAWSTSTIFPGGTIEEGFSSAVEQITLPDTDWHIVPLATVSLPSVRTKAGEVRVIIQAPTTGGPTTYLDEAWLFRVGDDCALTIVRTDFQHLWLNSAGVGAPVPTVWVGDDADVRVHPGTGLQAMGTHILSPGGTAVFTGVPSGDNPDTDATFYRRWHSNAAD